MCGIYGITAVDRDFIAKYIDVCKHRGPDGSNIWNDNKVTLGHNLLSIMGEPAQARQPWTTPKGNILVYNGEIFNYYELLEKYKNRFTPKTKCDTELLAWGLDTFGSTFVNELDSMHGFAYYDIQNQQITLSRDHAGIKPVFYAEVKEGLIFGSEIKGMLDKVPGSRILDKMAHSIFHYMTVNPLRNTFFSNIKKLLPGETIVYGVSSKKILSITRDRIIPINNRQYNSKEFKQQVQDAVKRCSIGNKKIGLFLSGGMDSAMISNELKTLNGEVNSYTTGFYPDPNIQAEDYNSDAKMAKMLAEDCGYNHTEVTINPNIYEEYWDKSIFSFEQIIRSPSLPANIYTNEIMRKDNVKVTMAGDLGDELLCGYPRHRRFLMNIKQGKLKVKSWKDICRYLVLGQKPTASVNKNKYSKEEVLEEFVKTFGAEMYNPADPLNSFCCLELATICPEEFLIRNDKFGMAYGMEGRYPLASKIFMKYCMSMHSSHKLSQFFTKKFTDDKYALKNMSRTAYKKHLPEYIINKTKTGWTAPMAYWMNVDPKLKTFYELKTGKKMPHQLNQKTGKRASVDMIWATWFDKFKVKNY